MGSRERAKLGNGTGLAAIFALSALPVPRIVFGFKPPLKLDCAGP